MNIGSLPGKSGGLASMPPAPTLLFSVGSILTPVLLQGLHVLQDGQPGQQDLKPGPATDTGRGEVLQQRGGPLLQPQQGSLCSIVSVVQ